MRVICLDNNNQHYFLCQPVEDISVVSWNRQVQHILASANPSGKAVVWDLRKNEPIIKISDHSNRVCALDAIVYNHFFYEVHLFIELCTTWPILSVFKFHPNQIRNCNQNKTGIWFDIVTSGYLL